MNVTKHSTEQKIQKETHEIQKKTRWIYSPEMNPGRQAYSSSLQRSFLALKDLSRKTPPHSFSVCMSARKPFRPISCQITRLLFLNNMLCSTRTVLWAIRANVPFHKSLWSLPMWAGRPRVRSSSPGRAKYFLSYKSSRLFLGLTQPHIQWVPGAVLRGVTRSWRETDHSRPITVEVKNTWIHKGCFTTLGHNCGRCFPRSLWSKKFI
jgi:hypothetical protein